MNELIDMLCGIAMCVVVYAPFAVLVCWNLALWVYEESVYFITSGEKRVSPDYVWDSWNEGYYILATLVSGTALLASAVVYGKGVQLDRPELMEEAHWLIYDLGVWMSPVIIFVLLGVAILFAMKYSYRLNKFTKKLNEHVKDKEVHKG